MIGRDGQQSAYPCVGEGRVRDRAKNLWRCRVITGAAPGGEGQTAEMILSVFPGFCPSRDCQRKAEEKKEL
jgi:hypothetical protein